jgi:hypothetical protein
MSENLDLVRSIYVAQARGDFSRADWADPEIEFEFADGPSPGVWKGTSEMARMWRDALSTYDELRIEAIEFREMGDERVLVLTESSGITKRSRLPMPPEWTRGVAVYRVSGGKVVGLRIWLHRDNALADLGLTDATPTATPKDARDIYGETWIDRS